jgi:hypothetical protein
MYIISVLWSMPGTGEWRKVEEIHRLGGFSISVGKQRMGYCPPDIRLYIICPDGLTQLETLESKEKSMVKKNRQNRKNRSRPEPSFGSKPEPSLGGGPAPSFGVRRLGDAELTQWPESKSWDQVLPQLDPKISQLYQKWDEIYSGEGEVPISSLLDPPLKVPVPADVPDDATANQLLEEVLDRLEEINIVVDVCDHLSGKELYCYVFEEILTNGEMHPDIPTTGIVEHFMVLDWCNDCKADAEKW